ncbi:MAG: hypothetical protein RR500_09230 [Bacilli bacterium]
MEKKIRNALKNHDVPEVPDRIINETVHLAKSEFGQTQIRYKMSFRELLVGQIKFISPSIWIIQVALLLIISSLLLVPNNTNNEYQKVVTILSMMAPIIAFVSIPELAKSVNHHMWEIELASKFSLQKLIVIRLTIIGVIDVIIMTPLVIIACTFYEIHFINVVLYILVPFSFASSLYLFILRKFPGKVGVFSCLITGSFITIGLYVLSNFDQWYETASIFTWFLLLVCSICTLVYEIMLLLQSAQKREELLWNY